jgi:hypothetical protein
VPTFKGFLLILRINIAFDLGNPQNRTISNMRNWYEWLLPDEMREKIHQVENQLIKEKILHRWQMGGTIPLLPIW